MAEHRLPSWGQDFSMAKQFERRQAAFKANMQVQATRDNYIVTGVEMHEYTPPSATNEHTTKPYNGDKWQELF